MVEHWFSKPGVAGFESRSPLKKKEMKALIEVSFGQLVLDVSFAGYNGSTRCYWNNSDKDDGCIFSSLAGLSFKGIKPGDKYIPFGSIEFVQKVAELLDISLPAPLNIPEELAPYIKRKVWESAKSELNKFPVFVKPKYQIKVFTGFVATSKDSFLLYPELKEWDGILFCSDPMPEILSEWRCYILKGEVLSCCCYSGDPLAFPEVSEIKSLISKYTSAPVGYSMDVAVTAAGTRLVECNDAWALGYYGGDTMDYFRLVRDRWLEIVSKHERSLAR